MTGPPTFDSGVVVSIVWFGQPKVLHAPVRGVENVIPRAGVQLAVEVVAARLGFRIDDDGAIGILRKEGRGLDLGLLHHIHVGRDGRCARGIDVG